MNLLENTLLFTDGIQIKMIQKICTIGLADDDDNDVDSLSNMDTK
jgi:hypothetical protein